MTIDWEENDYNHSCLTVDLCSKQNFQFWKEERLCKKKEERFRKEEERAYKEELERLCMEEEEETLQLF